MLPRREGAPPRAAGKTDGQSPPYCYDRECHRDLFPSLRAPECGVRPGGSTSERVTPMCSLGAAGRVAIRERGRVTNPERCEDTARNGTHSLRVESHTEECSVQFRAQVASSVNSGDPFVTTSSYRTTKIVRAAWNLSHVAVASRAILCRHTMYDLDPSAPAPSLTVEWPGPLKVPRLFSYRLAETGVLVQLYLHLTPLLPAGRTPAAGACHTTSTAARASSSRSLRPAALVGCTMRSAFTSACAAATFPRAALARARR